MGRTAWPGSPSDARFRVIHDGGFDSFRRTLLSLRIRARGRITLQLACGDPEQEYTGVSYPSSSCCLPTLLHRAAVITDVASRELDKGATEPSHGWNSSPLPLLIRCTQKLLAELPERFIDPSASGAGWHANLLRFERRKCGLFTHDETLYSVFVPGLRKPEFEKLDEVFGQSLFKALVWDAFSRMQIDRMLEAYREIRFTRSSNRSVLGSMNDMRFQIGSYVEHAGGLTGVDLAQLHHELNRNPLSAIGYGYAVERLQEYLARAPIEGSRR